MSFKQFPNWKKGLYIGIICGIFWSLAGIFGYSICDWNAGGLRFQGRGICFNANVFNLFGLPFTFAKILAIQLAFPFFYLYSSFIFYLYPLIILTTVFSLFGALVGLTTGRYSFHGGIIATAIPFILFLIRFVSKSFFEDIITILFGPYSLQGNYIFYFIFYTFVLFISGFVIGGLFSRLYENLHHPTDS